MSDPEIAAPAVTRALVGAGADVLSIGESRHSLEDVYLELIDEDVEAKPMSFSRRRVAGNHCQGAPRVPSQPLRDRVRDGDLLPLIFITVPTIQLLTVSAAAATSKLNARIGLSLLYMLVIPAARAVRSRRLLGGRRARAGHARADPYHARSAARSS